MDDALECLATAADRPEASRLTTIGRGNRDIAAVVSVGAGTIAARVHGILPRTGTSNRSEAARHAGARRRVGEPALSARSRTDDMPPG